MLTKSLSLTLFLCALLATASPGLAGLATATSRLAGAVAASVTSPAPPPAPAGDDQIQAVKVYARGHYAAVVALLGPKHQADRANIQQRLILARSYLHLGCRDDAQHVLNSVLAADADNPEAGALMGRVLYDRGEHKLALGWLQHAYRLKRDPATASLLGRCHYALGDPVKAKVHLEAALAADIRDPTNSLLLGRICLARGMGALAQKYLLMAQEAGAASAELHELLGRAYMLQRKYIGSVQARRLEGNPSPGDIVAGGVVLGKVAGVKGRYKVCAPYCALYEGCRLLAARPSSTQAHFMLAAGWLAAGNTELAGEHIKPLMQAQPPPPGAAELHARLLLAKGDYAALDAKLAAPATADGLDRTKSSQFYYHAAIALCARGNRKEAIRMLTKAEKLTPTSGVVLRSLAALHLSLGRNDQARQYYARLVELFPDADDIDQLRNTLRVLSESKGGAR